MKARYGYFLIILIQIVFCFLAFPQSFANGFDGLFCDYGDGLKNYYTLIRFVQEPIGEKGIFYFKFCQAPYGDYVYTADNTPIIALLLRWINHYVFDIGAYVIPVFNLLIIANIILSSVLLYFISRKYLPSYIWAFALALLFPWLSEQFLRIDRGHYNLSISSFFVLALILCHYYYTWIQHRWKVYLLLIAMVVITIIGFLTHGYYLPILVVVFGSFLLFVHWKDIVINKRFGLLLRPLVYIALSGVISFSILNLTDGYLDLRQEHAQGYNVNDQKLAPSYMYQTYRFNSINFPLRVSTYGAFAEPHMYIGHTVWLMIVYGLLSAFFSHSFRRRLFEILHQWWQNTFLRAISIAGFIALTISLGDTVYSQGIDIKAISFLNEKMKNVLWLRILAGTALISVMIGTIVAVFQLEWKSLYSTQLNKKDKKQLFILIIIILIMVLFLFSRIIRLEDTPNIINPFFYIKYFTRIIEQFRSLCRFAWPFILIFTLFMVYVTASYYPYLKKWNKILLSAMLLSLSASQLADVIRYSRTQTYASNPFAQDNLKNIPDINADKYETVLPVPFFAVGSEDYNMTIDDINEVSYWLYQFTYKNQIPMVAVKLSRTPVLYSDNYMNVLLEQSLKPLQPELGTKPILVTVFRKFMYENTERVDNIVGNREVRPKAFTANKAQFELIKNPDFKYLFTADNVDFYEWQTVK